MYAEQTRLALLDNALNAFVRDGYNATSIDAITSRTLVSKGALYRHFPDKKSLFLELFTTLLHKAANRIDAAADSLASTPRGRGPHVAAACAFDFARRSLDDSAHRELLRQAPEVLGERAYTELDDKIVLPPLVRLLETLASRGELADGVPVPTTARLFLRALCAANTIIARADDREAALVETTSALSLFFSGITA